MRLFLDITKAEQRIVEGIASTDRLDMQGGEWEGQRYVGDIVDPGALDDALPDWLVWGNIREMHQDTAAGTALAATVKDGKLHLTVKVGDNDAWEKVKERVYKGFSIGGKVLKAILEKRPDGTYIRRILKLLLTEISLVDRPANPDARILLFKGATMADDVPGVLLETDAIPPATIDPALLETLKQIARRLPLEAAPAAIVAKVAAADPEKIITLIQAARNACEMDGDTAGAALYTEAIKLILQASGDAEDDAAAEAAEGEVATEEPAPDAAAMALAAKAGRLRKAGRALSTDRMTALRSTCKALMQMLADAGDEWAQKLIGAGAGEEKGADAVAMAAGNADLQKAIEQMGSTLATAVLAVNDRLRVIEAQPAAGGPALRPAQKLLAANAPTITKAAPSRMIQQQMDDLNRKIHTEPRASLREDYQRQLDALRSQYA